MKRIVFEYRDAYTNGKWNRLEGYTSRARKSADFANKARKDYAPTATEHKDKLCLVADYIYLPLPYLTGCRYEFKGVEDGRVANKRFVKIEDFNEDFIEELVKFVPYAWFGGAITDYQDEIDIDSMFACNPEVPIAILDGTTYTFFVKSGNKRSSNGNSRNFFS